MEVLSKLETRIIGWLKNVPHLPIGVRKWIAENIWWIVTIAVVVVALAVLWMLSRLFWHVDTLNSPMLSYYVSTAFVGWLVVSTLINLGFTAIQLALMAFAISPLKQRVKRGWVLLFASWLVSIVAVVVGAILTFNPLSFIGNIIFGALVVAVTGYILFEIRDQFAHVEKTAGARGKKA